jgi:hypothetical protein
MALGKLPLLLLTATFFILFFYLDLSSQPQLLGGLDEFWLLHRAAKLEPNNSILEYAAATSWLDRWGR